MILKLKDNLIQVVVVAIVIIGITTGIGFATGGFGFGSGGSASSVQLDKGLVGHWGLGEADEKVGSNFFTNGDAESALPTLDGTSIFNARATSAVSTEQANNGSQSVKVVSDGTASNNFYTRYSTNGTSNLKNNTVILYRNTVWVYLPSGQTGFTEIHLIYKTNAGSEVHIDSTTLTDQWVRLSGTLVLDTVSAANDFFFAVRATGDSGGAIADPTGQYFYWDDASFKETQSKDFTSYSNHGTVYATSTAIDEVYGSDRLGTSSSTMDFNGIDEYILIPDDSSLDLETAWSISAWVYRQGTCDSGGYSKIVSKWENYFLATDCTSSQDNFLYGCVGTGSGHVCNGTRDTPLPLNEWHFLNFIYSESTQQADLYLDGQIVHTVSSASVTGGTNYDLFIGRPHLDTTDQFFDGIIDDVKIYDRALSQAEVTALYETSGDKVTKFSSSNKGLMGHWDLGEDSDKVSADLFDSGAGDFETDTGAWTAYSSNTIESSTDIAQKGSSSLKITYVDSANGAYMYFRDASDLNTDLVIGKRYRVTYWAAVNSGSSVNVNTNADDYGHIKVITSETFVKNQFDFTAGKTTGDFLYATSMGAGEIIYLDDISIKEIQVNDSTPNSNHGFLHATSTSIDGIYTTDRRNQSNKAMSFNGNGEYIDLSSYASSLNLTSGAISMWFNSTNNSTSQYMFGMGDDTADWGGIAIGGDLTGSYADESLLFIASVDTYCLQMYVRNGEDYYVDGNWHNVVTVVDGIENTIYVDGVKQSITYAIGTSTTQDCFLNLNNLDAMGIGRRFYPSSPKYFDGSLNDVRMYNRSLSQTEVTSLYDSYKSNISSGSLSKGLIGQWDLTDQREKVDTSSVTGDSSTFDSGKGDWSDYQNGVGTWTTNHLAVSALTTIPDMVRLTLSGLNVGEWYRISWSVSNLNAGSATTNMQFNNLHTSDNGDYTQSLEDGDFSVDLKANSGSHVIDAGRVSGNGTEVTFDLDNVTVKSILQSDLTPYSNHGIIYGATVNSDSTNFGGTDDYISIADSSNLNFNGGAFSVSAWCRRDTGSQGCFIFKGDLQDRNIWFNGSTSTAFGFEEETTGSNIIVTGDTALPANEWHHLVGTYDGVNSFVIYYDGKSDGTLTDSTNPAANTDAMVIGRDAPDGVNYINGDVSNIRIYNRELSAEEAEMLYFKGR